MAEYPDPDGIEPRLKRDPGVVDVGGNALPAARIGLFGGGVDDAQDQAGGFVFLSEGRFLQFLDGEANQCVGGLAQEAVAKALLRDGVLIDGQFYGITLPVHPGRTVAEQMRPADVFGQHQPDDLQVKHAVALFPVAVKNRHGNAELFVGDHADNDDRLLIVVRPLEVGNPGAAEGLAGEF